LPESAALHVILAVCRVGPTGKAIGIDITQAMIDLARRNAEKAGMTNLENHFGAIKGHATPFSGVGSRSGAARVESDRHVAPCFSIPLCPEMCMN
jgi:hypothetical protein